MCFFVYTFNFFSSFVCRLILMFLLQIDKFFLLYWNSNRHWQWPNNTPWRPKLYICDTIHVRNTIFYANQWKILMKEYLFTLSTFLFWIHWISFWSIIKIDFWSSYKGNWTVFPWKYVQSHLKLILEGSGKSDDWRKIWKLENWNINIFQGF